jgi:hypothetical protein
MFGKDFVNTYLSTDCRYIVVHLITPGQYKINSCLIASIHDHNEDKHYAVYQIPERWMDDVYKYVGGRLTSMSEEAKQIIRKGSGLAVRVMHDGILHTDARIIAFDPIDSLLRQKLRLLLVEELGCEKDIVAYDAEIMSRPPLKEFIYIPDLPTNAPIEY